MVRNLPAMQEAQARSLGWKDILEKVMAAYSNILAWKIPWTDESGRLQSMGSHRVGQDWSNLAAVAAASRTYLVAQMVKHLPTMRETRVQSLGWEDLLEKEMATHSSILSWKIPWMDEPGRLQSMALRRVGHDWATYDYDPVQCLARVICSNNISKVN